ncbi:MAG: hypothetical protein HQK89_02240 [Nitrospirae bacterium]|nr:hypothetical protein [Nitrospirota bacterium]
MEAVDALAQFDKDIPVKDRVLTNIVLKVAKIREQAEFLSTAVFWAGKAQESEGFLEHKHESQSANYELSDGFWMGYKAFADDMTEDVRAVEKTINGLLGYKE